MPVIGPDQLVKLQHTPEYVRNICVLAHVDHGKTSLSDSLIATNGIISPKMAGKIRYLDSRADEQMRGITMESSAISLFFSLLRRGATDTEPIRSDYLINLIDSPGHVDFSSEVSTASRLCDGAIVLVDAVEGICSQTVAVLRQTWTEHLKPILVINKMDRLIVELRMSAAEAYIHLSRLIEQVNAVMGSFFQGERMEDDLRWRERVEEISKTPNARSTAHNGFSTAESESDMTNGHDNEPTRESNYEEKDDEDIYFDPAKSNVIFCSAIDGWAFTVKQFAAFYEKKLGIKRASLEKVLWGDFYLDPKTKKVLGSKHLKGRALKPIFVQLVLDNIWAVYDATVGGDKGRGDPSMIDKITKSLSISLPPHVLRSRDPKSILTALCAAWIPLATAVLVTVIENLPSPIAAQKLRMQKMIDASPDATSIDAVLREAMVDLKRTENDPVVAFVSKMVSVAVADLPENKVKTGGMLTAHEARELARKKRAEIARAQANAVDTDAEQDSPQEVVTSETAEEPERLIGFARLYSGTLKVGDELYVLPPKFSPAHAHSHPEPQKVTITALYLLMGRSLEALTSVPAGSIFGVAGLEGHVVKSATLCSQVDGAVNLAGVSMGGQPIVRVALEPENPMDLDKMIAGLRILEQSDPCAAYEVLESGEHVIVTAGELHLERCLKDLRERFAKCEIQAGEPLVPYRETIIQAADMNPPREKDLPRGTAINITASKQVKIRLRVRPVPEAISKYLRQERADRPDLQSKNSAEPKINDTVEESLKQINLSDSKDIAASLNGEDSKDKLRTALRNVKGDTETWMKMPERIVAFSPSGSSENVLVDFTSQGVLANSAGTASDGSEAQSVSSGLSKSGHGTAVSGILSQVVYAFQLATAQGPLCHEQMQNVAVFLENIEMIASPESDAASNTGRLTSEVIKTTRSLIHQGFLDWSPRLLLAMYSCEIQASTEVLGRVYGVITRRRGRILSESMNEGTPFFTVVSVLPVAESFGFSDEIRKRTSGAASPQLIFQGYEMLDMDPFWVPSTEEELEDLGDTADRENIAKLYMDRVRKRKGLFVAGQKLVQDAEKQKTLKKN